MAAKHLTQAIRPVRHIRLSLALRPPTRRSRAAGRAEGPPVLGRRLCGWSPRPRPTRALYPRTGKSRLHTIPDVQKTVLTAALKPSWADTVGNGWSPRARIGGGQRACPVSPVQRQRLEADGRWAAAPGLLSGTYGAAGVRCGGLSGGVARAPDGYCVSVGG